MKVAALEWNHAPPDRANLGRVRMRDAERIPQARLHFKNLSTDDF
jgi:hypothetical protein